MYHDGANSVQFQLIKTTWKDFSDRIIVLHRLVKVITRKDWSFDDRLLSSAIAKCKQVVKRVEDKLRSPNMFLSLMDLRGRLLSPNF